jgi:probable rRNA maturation factor
MAVEISNRTKKPLRRSVIERSVEAVLRFGKAKGSVSVVIVGDRTMRSLNKRYRGKDKVTDILSFAESDSEAPDKDFIGELIIDLDQIERQAKNFGNTKTKELAFIVIHGALHLLGYEDESETGRRKMERLGEKLITSIRL